MKKSKTLKVGEVPQVTYESVKGLTDAGFDEQQAHAIANEQLILLRKYMDTLVTKGEFAEFRLETQKEWELCI